MYTLSKQECKNDKIFREYKNDAEVPFNSFSYLKKKEKKAY